MDVGGRYAYRARGIDSLAEVELMKIGAQKPARVQVRFVAEDAEGRVEWVPPARLKCPWAHAAEFEEREERWDRLASVGVGDDDPAYWAACRVFEDLIARDVAGDAYRTNGALRVRDLAALSAILDWAPGDVTAAPQAFEEEGQWLLPWATTLQIAQRLCQLRPDEVLAKVEESERLAEREATYGKTYRATRSYPEWHLSAEDCSAHDLEEPYRRPARELLKTWCGQEPVERRDELAALRAEVRRLGSIADRAIGMLRSSGNKRQAEDLERELGIPVEVFRGR